MSPSHQWFATLCIHFQLGTRDTHVLTLRGFSFKYGGSPSTISIAIIPKLHISTYDNHENITSQYISMDC